MLTPDAQKFRRLENEIAELKKENEKLKVRADRFKEVLLGMLVADLKAPTLSKCPKGVMLEPKEKLRGSYSGRVESESLIRILNES